MLSTKVSIYAVTRRDCNSFTKWPKINTYIKKSNQKTLSKFPDRDQEVPTSPPASQTKQCSSIPRCNLQRAELATACKVVCTAAPSGNAAGPALPLPVLRSGFSSKKRRTWDKDPPQVIHLCLKMIQAHLSN